MWHRLRTWGVRYFNSRWRVVPFQPVLFVMQALAAVHVLATRGEEIAFDHFAPWAYAGWLWLSVQSPLLLLCSAVLIRYRTGRVRYRGYWFRLTADVSASVVIGTFAAAWIASGHATGNDYRLWMLFMLGAIGIFLVELVIRDIAKLVLIERTAHDLGEE